MSVKGGMVVTGGCPSAGEGRVAMEGNRIGVRVEPTHRDCVFAIKFYVGEAAEPVEVVVEIIS